MNNNSFEQITNNQTAPMMEHLFIPLHSRTPICGLLLLIIID